jgi:hypothetical protein
MLGGAGRLDHRDLRTPRALDDRGRDALRNSGRLRQGANGEPLRLAIRRGRAPREGDPSRSGDPNEVALVRLHSDLDERFGARLSDIKEPLPAVLDAMVK